MRSQNVVSNKCRYYVFTLKKPGENVVTAFVTYLVQLKDYNFESVFLKALLDSDVLLNVFVDFPFIQE